MACDTPFYAGRSLAAQVNAGPILSTNATLNFKAGANITINSAVAAGVATIEIVGQSGGAGGSGFQILVDAAGASVTGSIAKFIGSNGFSLIKTNVTEFKPSFNFGTAALPVSSTNDPGTAVSFARADHFHAGIKDIVDGAGASVDFGEVKFLNSNGVSFSKTNGSQIWASYTVPTSGTAVTDVTSVNSAGTGTKYAVEDHQHKGVRAIADNGGNSLFGNIQLTNANGISFGTSAGNKISASYTVPTSGTNIQAVNYSNSAGVSPNWAPIDHQHAGVIGVLISQGNGTTAGESDEKAGNLFLIAHDRVKLSKTSDGSNISVSVYGRNAISAISASGGSVTEGNVSFANSNRVTFGVNGSTVTASNELPQIGYYENMPGHGIVGGAAGLSKQSWFLQHFYIPAYVFPGNFYNAFQVSSTNATSSSKTFSFSAAIYTRTGSTLSILNSCSGSTTVASTINRSNYLAIGTTWSNSNFISPGNYWMAMAADCSVNNFSGFMSFGGQLFNVLNTVLGTITPFGMWSASSASPPSSIAFTDIQQSASRNLVPYFMIDGYQIGSTDGGGVSAGGNRGGFEP